MKPTRLWLCILLSLLMIGLAPAAYAQDYSGDPGYLGGKESPILDHVTDPEKKKAMEADAELLRLFHEAQKAKERRRSWAAGLFIPGITFVFAGAIGGGFPNSLGLTEGQSQWIAVGGILGGAVIAGTGVYLRVTEAPAVKEYKNYIRRTYEVIPIIQLDKEQPLYGLSLVGRF